MLLPHIYYMYQHKGIFKLIKEIHIFTHLLFTNWNGCSNFLHQKSYILMNILSVWKDCIGNIVLFLYTDLLIHSFQSNYTKDIKITTGHNCYVIISESHAQNVLHIKSLIFEDRINCWVICKIGVYVYI